MDEAVRREVIDHKLEAGDFIFKRKGISYSVTVGTFSRNEWKYVVATPLSKLISPVILVSQLGFAISLIGLFVAIILSWLASRRIYRPVKHLVGLFKDNALIPSNVDKNDEFQFIAGRWRKLIDESHQLETKLEQNRQWLKEGFLLQLIQGHLYFFPRRT